MAVESDNRETCERIAVAMGWEKLPAGWFSPDREGWWPDPPNPFKCPVAADALMRWLSDKGYVWRLGNDNESSFRKRHYAEVEQGDSTRVGFQQYSTDWKTALAEAADKAIQEAERVGD